MHLANISIISISQFELAIMPCSALCKIMSYLVQNKLLKSKGIASEITFRLVLFNII